VDDKKLLIMTDMCGSGVIRGPVLGKQAHSILQSESGKLATEFKENEIRLTRSKVKTKLMLSSMGQPFSTTTTAPHRPTLLIYQKTKSNKSKFS